MKIDRGVVKNELGATLPLAMMMIVIIGVMGAGLLTFVSSDLNSVIEENRGQSALELADAGVAAAKLQLTSHCVSDPEGDCEVNYYDDPGNVADIQWSADITNEGFNCPSDTTHGICLYNLDGLIGTTDTVNVTIQYRPLTHDFRVVSTGEYGVARRKIEAIFKGIVSFGGSDGLGHPLYYTPSDIRIEGVDSSAGRIDLLDISLFSGGDILIQGDTTRDDFIYDMARPNEGVMKGGGNSDELGNWYTPDFPLNKGRGPWNTQAREPKNVCTSVPYPPDDRRPRIVCYNLNLSKAFDAPGMAAAGKICGYPADGELANDPGRCSLDAPSIADGVYGYDCTTGPVNRQDDPACLSPPQSQGSLPLASRGNSRTFVDKQPETLNPNDASCGLIGGKYANCATITFPFPRPTPDPKVLHDNAHEFERCPAFSTACEPDWDRLLGSRSEVGFVDANNSTVILRGTGREIGILVVWCGRLEMQSSFKGIILNLNGSGADFGGSSCEDDGTKGTFRNEGQTFQGWLYAEGGTEDMAGIELAPNSKVGQFPGGNWSFQMDALEGVPPNEFSLQGWRELYQ